MLVLGISYLIGCDGKETPKESDPVESTLLSDDADGDGSGSDEDCNDANPSVYPGATEIWYDGIDQACDGGDDYDQDGDGVQGGSAESVEGGPDCDDTNPDVYPGALEVCDDIDNDCSGQIDDNAVGSITLYADGDGDGYGAGSPLSQTSCEVPSGTAAAAGDCDDNNASVNPGQSEVCNGTDDDCDGSVDTNALDGQAWLADFDADGYGDPNTQVVSCTQPASYLPAPQANLDCDDSDPDVYPGQTEVCNSVDDDCDGSVDEDAIDPLVWYEDQDGDGDGNPSVSQSACTQPAGWVAAAFDCDDGDSARSSLAYEACDGVDNDCDGTTDSDSPDAVVYHPDIDQDGYGDATTEQASCSVIAGWLEDASDCDDSSDQVAPLQTEYCDGIDNNCDGVTDEDSAVDAQLWFVDADGDLFGSAALTTVACEEPNGYTDNTDDCDDGEPSANPVTRESCDGIDNDCDGQIDTADSVDAQPWYDDVDQDGYGDPASYTYGCSGPAGSVGNGEDCDDGDVAINPDGVESRDLDDEDCDGMVDEDFISAGDIVVSELARQPYAGGSGTSLNAKAQWFEVTNTSAYAIDLSGWYLEEQDGDRFEVSPAVGALVPAGGYAVFCYEDTWFSSASLCDYTWGDSSLGSAYSDTTFYFDRDEDLISLYLDGVLMDEVHWYATPEGDGDTWPATAHYSMQLDPASSDIVSNDDAGSWCLSSNSAVYSSSGAVGHPDYGTPGTANRSCN